jgi:hypothetical protein
MSFKVDPAFLVEARRIREIKRGDNAAGTRLSTEPLMRSKNARDARGNISRRQSFSGHGKEAEKPLARQAFRVLSEEDTPVVDGPTG